ncbi:MAG TPA: PLP-dependent aminotransferase family protein [Myxococcaceae bacterium]|jgi:GntR family transcriptional regulator/MocR family aminotransferase
MLNWELLTAALDARRGTPMFLQLSEALASDIRTGRLKPGDPLPGTRALATVLRVHRNTIIAGYKELMAQGLVEARRGGGTFVSETALSTFEELDRSPVASRDPTYAIPPPLRPVPLIFPPDPRTALILYRAAPDVRQFPAAALARAFRMALRRHGRRLLNYGDPRGHEDLRRGLSTMLAYSRGLSVEASNLMVTRGSQQAIDLIARALLSPGDVVAVEALGNPGTWTALKLAGADMKPVPVDDEGMDVEALVPLLKKHRVRAVYVTPHHQFPTNTVMSPARRKRLASLSLEHGFAIIEDDYDHEFHYEGRPIPPIAASPEGGNVLYLGSLSKILAPGLRMGFLVAPSLLMDRLVTLRLASDMQGDAAVEYAIAKLFEDGELLRHLRRMRRVYEHRRDALASALVRRLGGAVTFKIPNGGMALWVQVADDIDIPRWEEAGRKLDVLFKGAGMLDFAGRPLQFLRLGFTYNDDEELAEAALRMARALKR